MLQFLCSEDAKGNCAEPERKIVVKFLFQMFYILTKNIHDLVCSPSKKFRYECYRFYDKDVTVRLMKPSQ